jgi:hypothetical protein
MDMKTATAIPMQQWFRNGLGVGQRRIQVEEINHPERPLEIRRFVRRLRKPGNSRLPLTSSANS